MVYYRLYTPKEKVLEESNHSLEIVLDTPSDGYLQVNLKTSPFTDKDRVLANPDEHPFGRMDKDLGDETLQNGSYGTIVADNPVTRAIVELLQAGPEAIDNASGHTDWRCYRAILVAALATLWD